MAEIAKIDRTLRRRHLGSWMIAVGSFVLGLSLFMRSLGY